MSETRTGAGETVVILSCEHAGNLVPQEHRRLFRGARDVLASHRGWDRGALGVAETMAELLGAPLLLSRVTRLLVDLNRSLDSPTLFSEFSARLNGEERARALATHHAPHRAGVERLALMARGEGRRVAHVSVHSFVDELEGVRRAVDIGLLFDPARRPEAPLCERWARLLREALPGVDVRFNEPYPGIDDGLTTHLRGRFGDDEYLGIEVEVKQSLISSAVRQRELGVTLARALRGAMRAPGV